jgi:hypothetical protein
MHACWSGGSPMGPRVDACARRGLEQQRQITVRLKSDAQNVILADQPSQTQVFISSIDIDTGDEQVILSKYIDKEQKMNLIINLSRLYSKLSASSPWMMIHPCTHVCKEILVWSHPYQVVAFCRTR